MHRRCLLLLFATASLAFSQTTAGVNGTLTDSSGALIPGASVTITNLDLGARQETLSDANGAYQFALLQPGRYTLLAKKQGFKQVLQEGLELEVNQIARLDFTLEPGAVSETVQVLETAPLLESNTSSVGQVIETKAVSDLPLNGRNFAQLAILGPGVTGVGYAASGTIGSGTRPDDMRPGTELFSNGNREQSNNFLLDGV